MCHLTLPIRCAETKRLALHQGDLLLMLSTKERAESSIERQAYDPIRSQPYRVANPWFTGEAAIPTFSLEDLLATKLRALLQRNKGRDLIDLAHSLLIFHGLDVRRLVDLHGRYLAASGHAVSRAQAEQRMFEKLDSRNFMADVRPLLATDAAAVFDAAAAKAAFTEVFDRIIPLMPGAAWVRSAEMRDRFGV